MTNYSNQFKHKRKFKPLFLEKVNLTDVVLLLSFTFIFLIPFINLLIKTNF